MQKDSLRLKKFSLALLAELEKNPAMRIELLKNKLAPKFGFAGVPKNAALISALPKSARTKKAIACLRTRLTRTGSGVTPVAVMPKPYPCPGQCIYCPTATTYDNGAKGYGVAKMSAPKSYTGFEPATRRAIENDFDAKKQINMRLSQYEALGQPTQKCELILMGGTFLSVPKAYRTEFVRECYGAFNAKKAKTLEEAKKANERAEHRVIGLTVETRPDWCTLMHIDEILGWGATRVELGVQSLDDAVLKKVKRGHDVAKTIQTTRNLKDSAFKVGYHFMPGLYSDSKKDVKMIRKLFEDPDFCPDMLKLYPCLVIPGTGLYDEWKAGRFEPIGAEEAVKTIAQATKYFPPWVRVMRMQRDIPANKIAAGVKSGNLHQMVMRSLEAEGLKCACIRCREVFSNAREGRNQKPLSLELVQRKYRASGGIEHFLSFEDVEQDLIAGFIRLRLPGKSHRPEITESTALIRELHVYGQEVEIDAQGGNGAKEAAARSQGASGKSTSSRVQHIGIGTKLLLRAEEIASDAKKDKMAIISGVGAREYYRKFGYKLEGLYMCKKI